MSAAGGLGSKSVALSGNGGPTFTLSDYLMAFGNQAVSVATAALTVTLTNTGTLALPLSFALQGTNANQFAQTNTCGSSVAAGATCTINAVFLPTSAGSKTATLLAKGGAGAPTLQVSLTGTGVVPVFSLAPTSLAFGAQRRKTASAAKTVIVSNTGTVALPLTGVTLSGTNKGDFAQLAECKTLVAASSSCTIIVTFTPGTTGAKAATMNVTGGGGAGTKSVTLTGTGTT